MDNLTNVKGKSVFFKNVISVTPVDGPHLEVYRQQKLELVDYFLKSRNEDWEIRRGWSGRVCVPGDIRLS